MITTPSMGLKRWDQPNDIFSYVELSDNFALLDNHDHTAGKGVQVPSAGIANLAITDTKIANDAVTNAKIPVGSITGDRLVNSTIPDTKLSSPLAGIYRTIGQTNNVFTALAANTYVLTASGIPPVSGTSQTAAPLIIPWNTTHYTVSSKSTVLRLAVMGSTNSVAATSTFTFGIYPVTASAGAASQIATTLGTLGSVTAGYTAPAASTVLTPQYTADFALATGVYAIGCVITGAMAATSVAEFSTYLQIRYV